MRLGFFCTGQLNCVVGTNVSRRYILLPAIGRRGMGIVARLNKIGRLVKTLPAEIITLSLAEATFLGTGQARHRSDLVPDFGILVEILHAVHIAASHFQLAVLKFLLQILGNFRAQVQGKRGFIKYYTRLAVFFKNLAPESLQIKRVFPRYFCYINSRVHPGRVK